ncbi:hypothetical protein AX17_007357 [Amanita inopinata Kibby_2008]|nr:hypothetical protein AX17_007357 [Amanita inopinata Kibby_2008]
MDCEICRLYVDHVVRSQHRPLGWQLVLDQCERLRAELNVALALVSQYKQDALIQDDKICSMEEQLRSHHDKHSLNLYRHSDSIIKDVHSIEEPSEYPLFPAHKPHIKMPKTIARLQSLMAAAHEPGNVRALTKVKALCAEAHATPRELKTSIQQYLLVHWRNPDAESATFVDGSPLNKAVFRFKANPRRDDPVEVWYDYLSKHPTSWPRGVRRDAANRPYLPDLKASRAVARLKPDDITSGGVTASLRFEFMAMVIDIFDQPGLYETILERNRIFISAAVNYRPYYAALPVSIEKIVQHFANCGVTIIQARQELEPWAHYYKTSKETHQ